MRLKITFVFVFLFLLAGCSLPFLSSAAVLSTPELTPFSPEPSSTLTPAPTSTPSPEPYEEGFDLCGKHYTKDAVVIDRISLFLSAVRKRVYTLRYENGSEPYPHG